MRKIELTKNQIKYIHSLYEDGLSVNNISKLTNIAIGPIRRILNLKYSKQWKIKNQRSKVINNSFSYEQEQIILGTLLGDACLSVRKRKNCLTFELKISHGPKQFEYINHIGNLLGVKVHKNHKGQKSFGPGGEYYTISYFNKSKLSAIHDMCFKNGKKTVTKEWIDKLDILAITYWFLDDGSSSFDIAQKNNIMVRIATQSFSKYENELLMQKLFNLGIESTLRTVSDGTGFNIYIRQKSINQFMDLIAPHIKTSDMKYKIKRKY